MKTTLTEWLTYMQGIHVSAIDMGLSRVLPVAEYLDLLNSANDAYVFTVAGTNGKGSTTAVIAEICKQAGYKTGLYQSPHLIDFNERVRINGDPVSDEQLITAFEQVEQARLACGLSLSFFEMTTLASFLIFTKQQCDVWVLEVGLGGRLDVVNIIEPNMTVITNVGIDHVDWLGDDREKIGYEKAGILRRGVPLIFGDSDMPNSVQARITELDIDCYQRTQDFNYTDDEQMSHWQYSNSALSLSLPRPKLSLVNSSNAISAIVASQLVIKVDAIKRAMQQVQLTGRFDYRQLLERRWLFDVAHNEAGVQFLLSQLQAKSTNLLSEQANIYIVFSMLKDKDIDTVLALLSRSSVLSHRRLHWYIAPIDDSYCPRVADIRQLQAVSRKYIAEDDLHFFANLEQATEMVIQNSKKEDLILVCGSFHTISECLIAIDLLE